MPEDTSETPPSLWTRSFNEEESEPSFGVDADSEAEQSATPSQLRDFQPSLSDQVLANKKQKPLSQNNRSLAWAERSRLRRQAVAQTRQRVSGTALKTLGRFGGRLAGGVVGGVAGAAIAAGLFVKDFALTYWSRAEKSSLTTVSILLFNFLLAIPIIIALGLITQRQRSPNLSGATVRQTLENKRTAALAAGEYGIVSSSSIADLQKVRQRLTNLLHSNTTISPDARNRALVLLAFMADTEKVMKTSAYASDKSQMATQIKNYQQHVSDFYSLLFPATGETRKQAVAMLESGIISTNNICRGLADDDLRRQPLSPLLLNLIVEMGKFASSNGFTLEINCLVNGHRRGTFHEVGQAIDIQWRGDATTGKLLPFLYENRERFQLAEIIFNDTAAGQPAGFYNYKYSSLSLNQRPYAGDHKGHIHVAVQR